MRIESETAGSLAAISAQFFMALGFIIWDTIWSKSGGSAFALNLYKCNLASIGFVVAGLIFGMTTTTTTTTNNNNNNNNSENDSNNNNDDSNNNNNDSISQSVGYLILSGCIGIVLGDLAWLEALKQLGASKVILLDTIKPFSAALMGWIFLDETILPVAFSGIALTVLGILIVSLDRANKNPPPPPPPVMVMVEVEVVEEENPGCRQQECKPQQPRSLSFKSETIMEEENTIEKQDLEASEIMEVLENEELSSPVQEKDRITTQQEDNDTTNASSPAQGATRTDKRKGYILGIANIFLDTYGFVLTKQHGKIFTSWTINLIRFGSSGLFMVAVSCFMRGYYHFDKSSKKQPLNTQQKMVQWYQMPTLPTKSWMKVSLGVMFVTFLCPALSNYAVFQISLGLAMSLGSITPLFALLLEWPIHGNEKKPTLKALGGALVAISGVVILSIFNSEEK